MAALRPQPADRGRAFVVDAGVAAVLLLFPLLGFGLAVRGVWALGYVALVGVALSLRRIAPGVAATVLGLAALGLVVAQALGPAGQFAVVPESGPGSPALLGATALGILVIGYSVTVHRPLWMSLLVLAVVVAGTAVELVLLALHVDPLFGNSVAPVAAWTAVLLAGAWALGALRVAVFNSRGTSAAGAPPEPAGPRDLGRRWDAWLRTNEVLSDRILAGIAAAVCAIEGAATRGTLGLVLALALTLPLAWRRTRPVRMVVFVAGAAATQWIIDLALTASAIAAAAAEPPNSDGVVTVPTAPVPLLADLSVFAVVYAASAYASRRVGRVALVLGMTGAVLETAVLNGYELSRADVAPLLFTAPFAASGVLAAWAFGSLRRARWTMVHDLQERARLLEVERDQQAQISAAAERARIAREMHDVVAHSLAVVIAQADGGLYAAKARPEAAQEVLGTIGSTARQALAEMRQLLGVLREERGTAPVPPTPPSRSPQPAQSVQPAPEAWFSTPDPVIEAALVTEPVNAPQPAASDVPALVDRLAAGGLPVQLTVEGAPRDLPAGVSLAVYRIVQEALTNVLKHAGPAATARVRMAWSDRAVQVEVVDDGRGAAARPAEPGGGHGLVGMRERAALYGGRVDAAPRPGGGFAVRAVLPVQARPDDRLVEA